MSESDKRHVDEAFGIPFAGAISSGGESREHRCH